MLLVFVDVYKSLTGKIQFLKLSEPNRSDDFPFSSCLLAFRNWGVVCAEGFLDLSIVAASFEPPGVLLLASARMRNLQRRRRLAELYCFQSLTVWVMGTGVKSHQCPAPAESGSDIRTDGGSFLMPHHSLPECIRN